MHKNLYTELQVIEMAVMRHCDAYKKLFETANSWCITSQPAF